jgi:hypothetical protein
MSFFATLPGTMLTPRPKTSWRWCMSCWRTSWDLAPEGKRVAVVIPEGSAQAPQQEHEIVMLLNFADELRRRVPAGK